ncbi:unnamed protein product [Cochlearia groenlandica]
MMVIKNLLVFDYQGAGVSMDTPKLKHMNSKDNLLRSLIPSLIPAPSKRTPNSASSQPQRPTRDGKRRLSLCI